MVDWDALGQAGHDFTYCGMLMAGTSCYVCERCNAFMLTRDDGIALFHHARPACDLASSADYCPGVASNYHGKYVRPRPCARLRDQLDELIRADHEALCSRDNDR